MKTTTVTATGNQIRKPYAMQGKAVNSVEEACAAIPFSIETAPVARHGTNSAIPNTKALFRSDNGYCLGIHTPNFQFLQPCETLETFEKIRDFCGAKWSSAMSYKGGRQIMAGALLETEIVAPKRGDRIGISLIFNDFFDGTGKMSVCVAPWVLACTNGMTGLGKNIASIVQKHTSKLEINWQAAQKQILANLALEIGQTQEIVCRLDNADMTSAEMVNFAAQLFPQRGEELSTRTENMRESIVAGFTRGTGNVGRTRWDAFNAVTEFLDWQSTFRETEFSREENRLESLLNGNGARTRERALELLLN